MALLILKWMIWICLYPVVVICVPWALTRSWGRQHGSDFRPAVHQIFQRGELALVSLVTVIPVIWHILQSQFPAQTLAMASVLLAVTATMAASVWVECYCRQQGSIAADNLRGWRDSRNIALAVFTMATVIEILLDRFAQAVAL